MGPRLRELAPCGQREPGGGIHATLGPFYSPSLKCGGRAPAAIEAHRQQLARLLVQVSAIFYVKIRVNLSFVRTELGYKVGPRLRELAPRGQREPGGGIHAT